MGWLMFEDASDIYGDDLPVPSIAKKTQVSLSMQLLFLINI
jgi:hypothetical protein